MYSILYSLCCCSVLCTYNMNIEHIVEEQEFEMQLYHTNIGLNIFTNCKKIYFDLALSQLDFRTKVAEAIVTQYPNNHPSGNKANSALA